MMSGGFQSSATDETVNGGTHHKRENNINDEDFVQKKPRRAEERVDSHVEDKTQLVLTETTQNFHSEISRVEKTDDEISNTNCSSQHKSSLDTEINKKIQSEISKVGKKDDEIGNPSCLSLHKSSSDTVVVTLIEADAAEDKGSRHTMEDAWVVLVDATLECPGKLRCSHFAIYDGHGGRLAAEYARSHLHANVLSAGLPRELIDVRAAKKAILEGFRRTDECFLQESAAGGWQDGATAVCVWILGQTVFVANIGDAKAVLARSSLADGSGTTNSLKSIVITREHKAIYPQERARIQKAGGTVGPNGRLQGKLEVSRAFGDRQFKKVGVISTPDVHCFELTEREHFLILGCDGLWGVFGSSDAVEFVGKKLKEGLSATVVSRHLVREAVRERRCKDNCTAIVIVFRRD